MDHLNVDGAAIDDKQKSRWLEFFENWPPSPLLVEASGLVDSKDSALDLGAGAL
jgi:hypothetical protein